MSVTSWAQRHHRSILFLFIAFGIAGAVSIRNMPVGLFPKTTFPRVVVSADAGDRPASRMAIEVTLRLEEAVRAIPGVRGVRSTTSRGSAEVSIDFTWGEDMIAAALQVESATARLAPELPAGTRLNVRRMDPTVFPVIAFSAVSDHRPLSELRDVALFQIRPALLTIDGVSSIGVLGGGIEEYQVYVDPSRLESLGLTMAEVATAVSGANVVSAVGRLEDNHRLYLLLSDTQFSDFSAIEDTVIRSGEGGIVRIEDIAEVVKGTSPQWTKTTADGHDAVLFQVYQQPGGNTVEISRRAKQELDRLRATLPNDVQIATWYDQSELILASSASVRDAMIIGLFLAVVVLLLFLRNLRIMLVALIAVPLSLCVAVLALHLRGMSFNIMTLGGMAAAIALVIDDSLVMIEHIVRRFSDEKGTIPERVLVAATEFTRPLAGSSAATLIIFAPLAFLSGVTGAFFSALSVTIASCLGVSFFIAWLAVPLMAQHVLRPSDAEATTDSPSLPSRCYAGVMHVLGLRPWIVIILLASMVGLGVLSTRHIGQGFMPAMDEGGFILDYRAEAGTSLASTDHMARQIEEILRSTPEVETYSRRTGLQLGGGLTEANEGDMFVRLKGMPRRSVEQVMDEVRSRVESSVLGLEIEMFQLMEDLIGDLTAVPQPIEIKLFSDDEATLESTAEAVSKAISAVRGVVDVKSGIVLAGDAVVIRVDRDLAALEGLSVSDITAAIDAQLAGVLTTQVEVDPKMVDVRVWTVPDLRDRVGLIKSLRIRTPTGSLVPVSRLASVELVSGQPQITRQDLKRMVPVTARITGRDMASTVRDVVAELKKPGVVPLAMTWRLGGLYEQQQQAMRGLIAVFVAAVALVFGLLLFLYESFRLAAFMMISVAAAAAMSLCGLWITGTELNITAMMGLTMIVGIVTEILIFYYSEYLTTNEDQPAIDRMVHAGRHRARPITMTTLAAIFAMLPLALGLGEGSAMLKPMAIAIVAGLLVQLPIALLLFPAMLGWLGRRQPASRKDDALGDRRR